MLSRIAVFLKKNYFFLQKGLDQIENVRYFIDELELNGVRWGNLEICLAANLALRSKTREE
jgi:hypothetical protein